MTSRFFPLILLVLVGCDSGSGSSAPADTSTATDQTGNDTAANPDGVTPVDVTETQGSDVLTGLPDPVSPLPTLDNGTYTWTDGTNKITFTHRDGMVLVLESSFGCVGDTGCKIKQDFAPLTCNAAYTKGYTAIVEGGMFTVTGLKGTDILTGSIQAKDAIALRYEVRPSVSCCTKEFYFEAKWKLKQDCEDFTTLDCDPYTDTNCEAGFNCIFGALDKPVCLFAGERKINEKCVNQTVCSDGHCVALEGMSESRCLKYCKTDEDCGWNIQCIGFSGKKYKVCSLPASEFETCNILTQTCTKPGEACYYAASTVFQPICLTQGTGVQGDACTSSTQCAKGFDCIAQKECMKICDTTGAGTKCDSPFTPCPDHFPSQNAGYCPE